MKAFRIFHSVTEGYLQGSRSTYDFCRHKLAKDISLMHIKVKTIILEKINRQRAATVMDEVGILGRLLLSVLRQNDTGMF